MGKRGHERREPRPTLHHGTKEEGDEEQREEHRRIPDDRANGNDTDADERARAGVAVAIREGLDEHVCNDENARAANWKDDLGENDAPPLRTGRVTRQLVRRVSQLLLLVTRNHRPRQTAVSVPTAGLRARVPARHPPEELAVVDDEVGEGELMWVEQEGRDAKRQD